MTVSEFIKNLEEILPPAFSGEIDTDGAQCVPDPDRTVKKVLVSLDPYGFAVNEAVRGGYDLLLTHHPLFYFGREPETPQDKWGERLEAAGVAQVSFHMRLDNARGGVNDLLAGLLGLRNVKTFGIPECDSLGRIGELPRPVSVADFAATVRDVLGAGKVNYTELPDDRLVAKVAVLGGASSDFVAAAAEAGADAIVGGEFKHHIYGIAGALDIAVIEAGHYFTENPVCAVLADMVRRVCPGAEVTVMSPAPVKVI